MGPQLVDYLLYEKKTTAFFGSSSIAGENERPLWDGGE